ncbi:C2H2 transcription factor [Ilyonectria robusta]
MHGHGNKQFLCSYEGCERAVVDNGFPRRSNLQDHMRRVHNDGKVSRSRSGNRQPRHQKRRVISNASSARITAENVFCKSGTEQSLAEEWDAHRRSLEAILLEFGQPQDPKNCGLIKEAKLRLGSMKSISLGMGRPQKTTKTT